MLLQAQSQLEEEVFTNNTGAEELGIMLIKGKYLRGYTEFGAELRKKRRPKKIAAPQDEEEDPRGTLFKKLCEQFPEVAKFVHEHPFYFVYLLSFSSDDTVTKFFDFCHEFPRLKYLVNRSPQLLFSLVHLRGSLGHTAFTVLLDCLVWAVLLILILFFGPRRFFQRLFILMLLFQGKKRS